MNILALALAFFVAPEPAPPPPAPIVVPIYMVDEDPEALFLVGYASAILGIHPVFVNHFEGALVVDLVNLGDEESVIGTAFPFSNCHRFTWADRSDPLILAHEIGHLLGLEHDFGDVGNLMFPMSAGGFSLTEDQRATMAASATELASCSEPKTS